MAKTLSGRVIKAFEDKSLWKHNTLWTLSCDWNRYQDICYFKEKCQDVISSIALVVTIFFVVPFIPCQWWRSSFSLSSWNGKRRKQSCFPSILLPGTECLEHFRLIPGNWNSGNSGWIEWILESLQCIPSGSKRRQIDTVHIYGFDLSTGTPQAIIKICKNYE